MTQTADDSPKTLADHLKALGGAALMVGFMLLMLELLLFAFDPWGMRYFNDLETIGNDIFTPDDQRGYIMPDGEYELSHWQATIDDGARALPTTATPAATCTLAILGDSVAFGYGVDDADVWLAHLAEAFPAVRFVNYAVPRYNSTNVLQTLQTYPTADAYLYLVVNNDVVPAIDPATQQFAGSGAGLPWLVRYTNFALFRGGGTGYTPADDPDARLPEDANTRRFFRELETITADERVYLAAFANEALTNTIRDRGYDLTTLSYPPHRISVSDYHLNETGNRELAAQLQDLIARMIDEQCA